MRKKLGEKYQFLAGGGEMGQYMRSKDWASTAVGTPDIWPQSLRTTISIILNSKFPMFLFWGPDLNCFYNDAYRPSLGKEGKHPDILGGKAEDYWMETWSTIKPLIDQVLAGEGATWSEDQLIPIYRNGTLEDVYWTFSYSPVNDETGKPAGVLVICVETTQAVLNKLRLEQSKNELQFAIEATDLATWEINPNTYKFTGDDRLKEWHGLASNEAFELDTGINSVIEKDRDSLKKAIEFALSFQSGGNFDQEYQIINPKTKIKRYVRAKGKVIFDENNLPIQFKGTLQDITNQKNAEREKQKLIDIIEGSDQFIGLTNVDYSIEYGNPAALQMLGWDSYENRNIMECIFPPDREFASKLLPAILQNEAVINEIRFWNEKTGEPFWLQWNGLTILDPETKEITGLATISPEITEKRLTQKALELSERNLRLMILQAPVAIGILRSANYIVEIANSRSLEIWGRTEDEILNKPILDAMPELLDQGIKELLDDVYKTGNRFSAAELPVNILRNGELQTVYINFSYEPLYAVNGSINGIMAIGVDVTEQALNRKKIEASEKEFRQLADTLPELVWTTDKQGNQTFASKRWKEFTGLNPGDLDTFTAMAHPDDAERVMDTWLTCLKNGTTYKTELRLKSKEGEYEWFYANANPIKNENGDIEKWVGAFTNINDQKKAETNLRIALQKIEESEQRFQKIADYAPVMIRITNTERLTTYFNKAWLQFRGKKLEDELNNGWREGLHPDDEERFLKTYEDAFKYYKEFYTEYRLKRYDGEYRWISHHGAPRFTSDGNFEGYIGACMDIHEQIMYNDQLQANEEKLKIVIEASELGTWELNLQEYKPTYSERYLQIFGYDRYIPLSREELRKHIHPDDLQILNDGFEKALQTGILSYEIRLVWKDGSIHWIDARGKVFYDEQNQPLKLIGTIRDITAAKYYQQELIDREKKFRLLADSMPQFVWTADAQGNLNYFNQAVYNYSGLSVEQIEKEGWLQIVHPDERDENEKAWMQSINQGVNFIFEHRFRRNDGVYRWQLSRAIPQRDADGNIQMWVGTSTDIQEIKEQEQQKDYFISLASHELKTPVTSIKGYVQILQSMYEKGEDSFLINSLKIVEKQITTLTKLISELLDISKIKSGGLDFSKEDFEINELVKETVAEMQHIYTSHTINVSAPGNVMVYADSHRIAQVLINFLTNAVKYAPNSKNITVFTVVEDNYIKVSVKDEGIGISKNDQERIFERFYRVEGKNEKTFPGFGIGLFIASEIIKKHKGVIAVDSEPGKGSVFSFSLPVKHK